MSPSDAARLPLGSRFSTILTAPPKTSVWLANVELERSVTYSFDTDWKLPTFRGLQLANWIHLRLMATYLSSGGDSLERLSLVIKDTAHFLYGPNIRPSHIGEHA